MKYAVVHSNDPWLLARLATDLQMLGIEVDDYSEVVHVFNGCSKWIAINHDESPENTFAVHTHECKGFPIRHELTEENYINVLTQILNP